MPVVCAICLGDGVTSDVEGDEIVCLACDGTGEVEGSETNEDK